MNSMRILLSGSSGLVGSSLLTFLQREGHQVVRLVRKRSQEGIDAIYWDPAFPDRSSKAFEGFNALIHLAGENISDGRWTRLKKQRLIDSRCRDSRALALILSKLNRPPQVVLSASAVGFYGDRGDEVLTERSSAGRGFLAQLCIQWEEAFEPLQAKGVRTVQLRFGPILSVSGGMLKKLLLPFKWGLGGRIGTGNQNISWIGIDDALRAIYHSLLTPSLSGPVNVTAPYPVTQAEFARVLAKQLHRPAWLPLPAFLVRVLFGEMGEALLLSGAYVIPEKLLKSGYQFQAPKLTDLLSRTNLFL